MVAVYQTAYPRIKKDITTGELGDVYTPTRKERQFALKHCKKNTASYLGIIVQLKILQRLGRFVTYAEIPKSIVTHIKQRIKSKVTNKQLKNYYSSGTKDRHVRLIRQYLRIKPYDYDVTSQLVRGWALEAAKTKEELADIINVTIERLVKENFELPGFRELQRICQSARVEVNNTYYQQLCSYLNAEGKALVARLLQSPAGGANGFG